MEDVLGALDYVEAKHISDGWRDAAAVTHDERLAARVVSREMSVDVRVGAELLDEGHLQPDGTIEATREAFGPETECHGLEAGSVCRIKRFLAQRYYDIA
jgi:hypothetical protein